MNEVFEELRSAAHQVWQRRWLAIAVAWGIAALGWLVVSLIPNTYESRARLYVEVEDILSEQLNISGDGREEITRVRQTLASATNLEQVIRSTRLGADVATDAEMQRAINSLNENIAVVSENDNLFEVTARSGKSELSDGENADLAQAVVQKLIDIFREENIAGTRGDVTDALAVLDRQLDERKLELEAAEQRRLAFEAQYPELVGGTGTIGVRLQGLRTEMRSVDADIAAAGSALAAISGQLGATPRAIITPGAVGGARAALGQAQAQLAALRSRGLTDNHPDMQAARRQVALLESQASQEGDGSSGSPNPAYSSLIAIRADRQANLQALQARKAALQADISSMIAAQAQEPAVAAEANRISRDYEVLKTKYDELLEDREALRVRSETQAERSSFRFQVVDPPTAPRTPRSPNRPLLLIAVLMAGLAGGIGTAFAVGQLSGSFTSADKLERALDLPVVGTISRARTTERAARETVQSRKFAGAMVGLFALCALLLAIEFIHIGSVA